MPYMLEYTLFATLAFHHLLIGFILSILIAVVCKILVKNTELKSWLWMTAFIIATVTPLALISNDHVKNKHVDLEELIATSSEEKAISVKDIGQINALKSNQDFEVNFWHLRPSIVFDYSVFLSVALFVWLVGSLWRIAMLSIMWFRTLKVLRFKGKIDANLSHYIGLPVYVNDFVSSPMVLGYLRPKVIVPQSIIDILDTAQIKAILQHEKAHIIRKDNFFGLFQELIAIAFWWSPIMRYLNKNIHLHREMACDMRAAKNCDSPKHYAQSLLDCAKLMIHQHNSVLAMGIFSKKKELKQRISEVLTQTTTPKLHTLMIIIICSVFSLSSIQAAQALVPKISIKQTSRDVLHYSILPTFEGQALISAVMRNDVEAIKVLQQNGVDINTPAIGDGTALMIAIKQKNFGMVEALIDLGADVNQSSIGDGNPLIVAAMQNNVQAAQFLLSQGANINAVVAGDESALITASFHGHYEMVAFLLDQGADVNLAVITSAYDGNEVRTALSRAKTPQIEDLLRANGAL